MPHRQHWVRCDVVCLLSLTYKGACIDKEILSVTQPGCSSVPVEGLQLGHLLGKGSYGRVYHGFWHGQEVAVKVGLTSMLLTMMSATA